MVSSSVMIWLVVCLLLCIRSWDLVMLMISFIGILTKWSLMSRVSNLCLLLIFNCISSLARALELMTLYWFSRCRWLLRIVFSFFAALYVGAVLLLTTGRMGVLGLCSFSRALSVGGDGVFWVKYLMCFCQ